MNQPVDYGDYIEFLRKDHPELAGEIGSFLGLGEVLDWMKVHKAGPVDLIGQDEFEYDFMIQLAPAGSWLVFGVT